MSAASAPVPTGAGSTTTVQQVNPARQSGWDAMIANHPRGSFFHSAAWCRVLEGAYGYAPAYFTSNESGSLKCLLPLMEVDSWLTGRRGVSLPFTDDCEPLYSDADAFKNVLQSVIAHGRARKWKHVEFRGGRKLFGEVPASLAFFGHELDLSGDETALFERVDTSVRRAIRKAEKAGVTVELTDTLQAMRNFFGLYCLTRRKHGLPPQPFHFFQNIHEHVVSKKLGVIITAHFEGRAIASAVYFGLGARAIYKYGASDEAHQSLRGNNLVMWEAIKWHARQGFKTLHLGRTSLGNEGLRRYKLGWGAKEERIEYIKYDLQNDRFLTDRDETAGWHNRIFSNAPIFLSRMIGAGLYRHCA